MTTNMIEPLRTSLTGK